MQDYLNYYQETYLISVQTPTKLNTKYLYQLNATDYLLPDIIPLAVGHKIDHKYPTLLKIPLFNTEHVTIHVSRKTIIGKLQPIEIEDIEVSSISCTKDDTNTAHNPVKLQSMIPVSGFQPEHNNTKHGIVLLDAKIPQEVKYVLSALLDGNYHSIISKSPMVVGRMNIFQMDITTTGLPTASKLILYFTKLSKVH